ncbi:translation initiation factor IF-2-like [Camelus ferus]|uniref:Translation initiation factor IF-2-like n=1 Tax=Camelus ferus TaxID=419612 RepID=A0A8B8UEX4_CAMFR|nr:translation initiation factor IF-2-like [Camelus ferus]XP_032352858.1 translation initiation factor IF-2-like [Camelus ferus]
MAFFLPPHSPAAPLPSRRASRPRLGYPARAQAPGRGVPRRTRPRPPPRHSQHLHTLRGLGPRGRPGDRGSGGLVAVLCSPRGPGLTLRAFLPQPGSRRAPRSRRPEGTGKKRHRPRPPLPCPRQRSRSRTVAALPTSIHLCAHAEMQHPKKKKKKKKKFKIGKGCPHPMRRENGRDLSALSAGRPWAAVTETRNPGRERGPPPTSHQAQDTDRALVTRSSPSLPLPACSLNLSAPPRSQPGWVGRGDGSRGGKKGNGGGEEKEGRENPPPWFLITSERRKGENEIGLPMEHFQPKPPKCGILLRHLPPVHTRALSLNALRQQNRQYDFHRDYWRCEFLSVPADLLKLSRYRLPAQKKKKKKKTGNDVDSALSLLCHHLLQNMQMVCTLFRLYCTK